MQDFSIQGSPIYVPPDILTRSSDRLQAQLRAAGTAERATRDAELRKASQEFESLFVAYLLKVMRDTIEESGLTEGGFGKGIYTELFDQEMSRGIAQHGALGIADLIYRNLSAQAEKDGPAEAAPAGSGTPGIPSQTAPPGTAPADDPQSDIPDFKLPVPAPTSSAFGIREDPFSHRPRFHRGIDLAVPAGTEVRAARGGEVEIAGYQAGFGCSVVVRHAEGFKTRYAHLGTTSVKAGEVVTDGQVLGTAGSTGRSTGPHLHFEVIRGGEPIDPMSVMAD